MMSERVYIPNEVILITQLSDTLAPKPSIRKMIFMLSCESRNVQEQECRAGNEQNGSFLNKYTSERKEDPNARSSWQKIHS